jgi:hypothetical protein
MKLPKGWYRVRTGCKVKPGDRWLRVNWEKVHWVKLTCIDEDSLPVGGAEVIIRRDKRKAKP